MSTLTPGYVFGATEQVTNTKLGLLVSSGSATAIVNSDIDSGAAIANSKLNLASISQAIAHSGGLTLSGSVATLSGIAMNMAKGSDIASATTTDIGAATGNYVHVTGTTTITGLGTIQAGTWRLVRFTGALTFTHNSTSLILPTAANITTAADDHALMVSLGSGNWICASYTRKSGVPLLPFNASTAPAGTILQIVTAQSGAVATGTTTIPNDDTDPNPSSEGNNLAALNVSITANSATNRFVIIGRINLFNDAASLTQIAALLWKDSDTSTLSVTSGVQGGTNYGISLPIYHEMATGSTSAITFKVNYGSADAGTVTVNGNGGARKYGGKFISYLTVMEVKV